MVAASATACGAFEEWYLGTHIEDVSHAPGIIRATTHRLIEPIMKTDPPQYIAIFESEAEKVVEASAALRKYLERPIWPGSKPPNGSFKVLSSGWYEVERSFSSNE